MKDWLITYGSWGLAPFGLAGMYVVGLKKTWGWVVSMTTQALWAAYAIGTGQFGFLIGTVSYFVIYLKNWLKWRREGAPKNAPVVPCRRCPHPMGEHDEEGCTVMIPYDEDPDFGDTQTCPCCERGEKRS